MGINTTLNIGTSGLFAAQTALQVTGDNISNVNTQGYARRELRVEEGISIDFNPGQLGTGIIAKEVFRHFDQWIENSYNDKSSMQQRWESIYNDLKGVESLFNESFGFGASECLSKFLADWQDLSQRPEDFPTREALTGDTKTLLNLYHQTAEDLNTKQYQVDDYITQDTEDANTTIQDIANLNKEINIHDVPGVNNANTLSQFDVNLRRTFP